MEVASLLLLLTWLSYGMGEARDVSLQITRQNLGDVFIPEGIGGSDCNPETCVGLSSGTAAAVSGSNLCNCQCHSHLPAFREDLRICVDDIHECILAPFVGGATSQQIPFVFLPLKGQIIHPSKEISFSGVQTPVCAVSGAKFLTEIGWIDLRNPVDTDVPFRLFRDEGRTFLQWVGEPELRSKMSGRLVMVYLMCRELAPGDHLAPTGATLFSPCVAFRIVGSPSKYPNNVSEVAFSTDTHSSEADHLSVSEYVAIGICSVLLGLIYVASVFLYLHLRKRNRGSSCKSEDQNLATTEEGVVKNNPLLTINAHFQPPDTVYSDSTSSDEMAPDIVRHHEDKKKSTQTSAMIHQYRLHSLATIPSIEVNHQDSSSFEKIPEANVSIVETLDGRDERNDTFKAITGPVRKKLYFNPAYFEPQLLMAPPPAAVEFLSKIREVITIAKQKMAQKKFAPSLMGIPEEDGNYALDPLYDHSRKSVSRRSSIISLKRENSRRKQCAGCPGCEPQDFSQLCGKLPEFPSLAACQNCSTTPDSKQRSIRKWLEDVPILKHFEDPSPDFASQKVTKRLRSPTRSLPPDGITAPRRTLSPKASSERGTSPNREVPQSGKEISKRKAKAPSPPKYIEKEREMNFPPPDMIHEAMAVDNKAQEFKIPSLTKRQMKAVITEFRRTIATDSSPESSKKPLPIDYETDSLERTVNKGYSTPSEYAELSSSQPSPSLSAALPMDEEITMRNAIFNKRTGNMTISKISVDTLQDDDDHDYELIVLKRGSLRKKLLKLPELLHGNSDYNLVTEVYVNNGYNYGSAPSSPSESNCSTLEKRTLKVRYEDGNEQPGKLLIEVEDCPDHYIPVDDSDSFEPDTLDRKPSKRKIENNIVENYNDSLERPHQIQLKSSGSFKNETSRLSLTSNDGNFNRVFGSLREIYEAKTKLKETGLNDEGRLLTLEERHSKRQRRLTTAIPPDVVPPPPHDNSPIYERPKPPRKVISTEDGVILKPPLPPKNGNGRSTNTVDNVGTPDKKSWKKLIDGKLEDCGYLSIESNDYKKREDGSESEESLDGHSESGAESIETHSVFFNSLKKNNNYVTYGSMDSGVDADGPTSLVLTSSGISKTISVSEG